MTVPVHLVPAVLVTTLTGVVMLRLGLSKGQLRARSESRRCASCGRRYHGDVCPGCARR